VPTIVIPFRPSDPKRRLGLQPAADRIRLAEAMLADVVAAAQPVGKVVIADGAGGQGAAVRAALAGVQGTSIVVNADLPCVTSDDLRALVDAVPPGGIAVAAAADGTTNALGLADPRLFEPLYGPGSAARYAALAPAARVEIPNLVDDVDTVADLARVGGRAGAHTRAVLDELRRRAAA
jgi:2-phospho-L-lactate guanylyltransferase